MHQSQHSGCSAPALCAAVLLPSLVRQVLLHVLRIWCQPLLMASGAVLRCVGGDVLRAACMAAWARTVRMLSWTHLCGGLPLRVSPFRGRRACQVSLQLHEQLQQAVVPHLGVHLLLRAGRTTAADEQGIPTGWGASCCHRTLHLGHDCLRFISSHCIAQNWWKACPQSSIAHSSCSLSMPARRSERRWPQLAKLPRAPSAAALTYGAAKHRLHGRGHGDGRPCSPRVGVCVHMPVRWSQSGGAREMTVWRLA